MRFLIATLVVAGLLGATAGAATTAPRVWVKRLAPVRIDGSGFPARARVLVSVDTGSVSRSSWTRATTTGRISVSFTGVSVSLPKLCLGQPLFVTAKTKGIARVVTRLGGSSRDCAQRQPVNK